MLPSLKGKKNRVGGYCSQELHDGESLGWTHTQHFNFGRTHKTKKKLKKNKIIIYQLM